MPTTNTRYVDPDAAAGGNGTTNALSGGNCAYVSLNVWEAARQANLVTGDLIEECVCDSNGASHTEDTTAVVIDGWTTGASNYISIHTPVGNRHSGVWDDTKYRFHYSSPTHVSMAIRTRETYIRFDGLQIVLTPTVTEYTALYGIYVDAPGAGDVGDIRCSTTVFKVSSALTYPQASMFMGGYSNCTYRAWNNICYDVPLSNTLGQFWFTWTTSGNAYLYNNTFVNCHTPINGGSANQIIAVNNLFKGTISQDCVGTFAAGTDYNASSRASIGYTVTGGGNSHDRVSQTFTFANEGGKNFHLASNDAGARDYGVTDPGSGLFSDDIDGVTRSGTWDIGADEYVAAGGGGTIQCIAGSMAVTGSTASLLVKRAVTTESRSYAVTGFDATLKYNRDLITEVGTIVITGTDSLLGYKKKLEAITGAYTINGQVADLKKMGLIILSPGAYTIGTPEARLTRGKVINTEVGAVVIGTPAAGLYLNRIFTMEAGAVSVTGTAASLLYRRLLMAEAVTVTLTAPDANLLFNRILDAEFGAYSVTGSDANVLRALRLGAATGAFTITGASVVLTYSGEAVPDIPKIMTATFTVSRPSATFSAKSPGATFTVKRPGADFTVN